MTNDSELRRSGRVASAMMFAATVALFVVGMIAVYGGGKVGLSIGQSASRLLVSDQAKRDADTAVVYGCGFRAGQDDALRIMNAPTQPENDFCSFYRDVAARNGFAPRTLP